MSLLLLVRHGQASWGADDYDVLSETGHEQGRVLGAALAARGLQPDLLVRGSLRRHRETAEAAVATSGWRVPVEEDADWDEFDHMATVSGVRDFPDIAGETYDEREERVEAAIERWASGDHDDEYHESFPAFRGRVEQALRRTLDRLGSSQTAVVFTSGGPVSWVTASLLGGGVPAWPALSRVVVNTGVTRVLVGRRGTSLLTFNEHSHLEATPDLITYK